MAKRFTDTDKWKRSWFTALSNDLKVVWSYIIDQCDHAGVWPVDFGLLKYQTGVVLTHETFSAAFGDKVTRFDDDKYFIPSFVEFQYGELKPENNAHKGVIKILTKLGAKKVLTRSPEGPQEQEQEQEQDKDQDQVEGSVRGEIISPAPIIFKNENMPTGDLRAQVEIAIVEWSKTLDRHKVKKDPWLDAPQIGQLIQAHKSVQKVALACLGAGYEAKGDGYDPSKNIGITRLFTPKIFDKFVNLGAQAQAEEAAKVERRAIVQKTHAEIAEHSPMDDLPPLSPEEQGMFQKKFKQQIGKGA